MSVNYLCLNICVALIIFLIMYYYYEFNITQNITPNIPPNIPSNTFVAITERVTILNNLKEQFDNTFTQAQLLDIINILDIRDTELTNLNQIIANYIEQISQNNTIKEEDRKNTIDILSQIYAIKLNDSINKLNKVAYNEYLKTAQNKVHVSFKP